MMALRLLHSILIFIVSSIGYENLIFVYGDVDGNKEMMEQGRVQYQIIKERGTLPKYGPCWKAALEHLSEDCRYLSEETQSDIALHITNCFLEMSGHETYNCELDKKANLRGICINSMSDRAFNVYTEFYTHTQNICWFLRGHIWHETIAENTLKVGKQLEISTEHQENLIKIQKESILLQDKMLTQGKFVENVLAEVYEATKNHQEILKVLTKTVSNLQSWIVGEVSWLDSIIFNAFFIFLMFIFTSAARTAAARLPVLFLLFLNVIVERIICSFFTKNTETHLVHNLYDNLYNFIWYTRYAFTFLAFIVILYVAFTYQDLQIENYFALDIIKKQNNLIINSISRLGRRNNKTPSTIVDFVTEDHNKSFHRDHDEEVHGKSKINYQRLDKESSVESNSTTSDFNRKNLKSRKPVADSASLTSRKYELRSYSRNGTPDSGVVNS